MPLDKLRNLLEDDLQGVDRAINEYLDSDVPLIPLMGNYVVSNGGKRLRPMVLLATARMYGYEGERHVRLAAVLEFIHTATLMHDDVVDASEQRRTQPTANAVWGTQAPVLVGDFLFARAFQAMVADGELRVLEIISEATRRLAEGEVLQLQYAHEPDTSEDEYLRVITAKTATLFEAAARLGAVLNGRPTEEEEKLATFGRSLGIAFQLVDDCLDYVATAEEWGKNLGDDLAEGKPTLPTLYALGQADAAGRDAIHRALESEGTALLEPVMSAIEDTGAVEYTLNCARAWIRQAKESLADLPDTTERRSLEDVADFVVDRQF
jgi:octaprenyl-diphosphate synthase